MTPDTLTAAPRPAKATREDHAAAVAQSRHEVGAGDLARRQLRLFWIVDYAKGSTRPTRFQARKQVFAAPFDTAPSNDWGTPPTYPENSKCEK